MKLNKYIFQSLKLLKIKVPWKPSNLFYKLQIHITHTRTYACAHTHTYTSQKHIDDSNEIIVHRVV